MSCKTCTLDVAGLHTQLGRRLLATLPNVKTPKGYGCDVGNKVNWKACRICGRSRDEAGGLSRNGKCVECGEARQVDAITQMVEKRGPLYDKWKAARIEAARALLSTTPEASTAPARRRRAARKTA